MRPRKLYGWARAGHKRDKSLIQFNPLKLNTDDS